MRHTTDGELHAFLDGSLDQLARGRGDEIRTHLEACPACRERLQDEEEIRDRAQGILATISPPEVELPSFEALRARAEASEAIERRGERERPVRNRAPLGGIPLAWAATVVLALGVGWMGGEVWRTGPVPDFGDPVPPNSALRPAGSGAAPAEAEAVSEDRLDHDARALSDASGADAEGAGLAAAPTREPSGNLGRQEAPRTPEPGVLRVEESARRASEADAREKVLSQEPTRPQARVEEPDPVAGAAFRADPLSISGEMAVDAASAGGAGVEQAGALAVPGFEVVMVEWEEWVPGERALHIRQLLPMGDTLELRYLGLLMGADPGTEDSPPVQESGVARVEGVERPLSPKVMEASLPAGWNQVVMRWRRGWLVARAPLSEESLRGILRALR